MSVIITNLSLSTSRQQVEDFFNFCGKIASLTVTRVDDENAQAIVTFESETSCKTAVLLDNALINDRPIKVELYEASKAPLQTSQTTTAQNTAPTSTTTADTSQVTSQQAASTTPQGQAQGATFAGVLASTWHAFSIMGEKIKEVDERYKISEGAKNTADKVSTSLRDFDHRNQISAKANGVVAAIGSRLNEIDQKYEIKTKINSAASAADESLLKAATSVRSGFGYVSEKVNTAVEQSPTMSAGIQKAQEASSKVREGVQQVGTNTRTLYEEKQALRKSTLVPQVTASPDDNPSTTAGVDTAADVKDAQEEVPAPAETKDAPLFTLPEPAVENEEESKTEPEDDIAQLVTEPKT